MTMGSVTRIIHGLKAEFQPGLGDLDRSIGEPEAVYDADSREGIQQHFEIDGQGGEKLTEIAFSSSRQAISLRTNKGRQVCFGDAGADFWHPLRPEEGETLVGLIVSFEGDGTYDFDAERYDRIKILSVAALAMRL
ncbi:hypothetical protein BGZ63DRAFT_388201 [Mariannaea sp. PMI_226]|nr:hypothetical protein BGZ63DRAFT_388201 [Mariannaea sp. PMI_226]